MGADLRAECLDWLLIVGRGHLEQVLGVHTQQYNCHRPHRALALQSPQPSARPTALGRSDRGAGRRRDLRGGLPHEYQRAARTPLRTLRAEPVMQVTAKPAALLLTSGNWPLSRLRVDGQPQHAYAGGWIVSRWRS